MGFDELEELLAAEVKQPTAPALPEVQIAIVDDDPSILQALGDLLSKSYQVLAFDKPESAVEALTEGIAAVILDIKMKGHSGFWACDAIRQRNPHVPIIFYSAYQDMKSPWDIINQHRPFGYIMKGSDPAELTETVDRAVRYYDTIMELKRLLSKLREERDASPQEPPKLP
jgi:DNA-binding NtrC family response regulator